MIPAGGQPTPMTPAKRAKRWIVKSIVSASRKAQDIKLHRRTVSDAKTPASTFATVLLRRTRKDARKVTQPSNSVSNDIFPSETKTAHSQSDDGTGLSEPPSLPGGEHPDSEPASVPEPPSLPSPSPSPPDPSKEDSISVHIPSAAQSLDEAAHTEITEAAPEPEPKHTGAWFLSQDWDLWGDPETAPASNEQEPQDPSTYVSPTTAKPKGSSTSLVSSDELMTLTLRNFLGAGSFGKVVSADWAEESRQVAVKVSHKLYISEYDWTEIALRKVKNELDILKVLKKLREGNELGSKFFPELLKSWQDDKNVYFAMALYPWDLERLRWANPNWDASIGDKILWTAEMIVGVQALHRMRILHRDIKPENIFVTAEKHLIIGDYSIAHAWMDPFYANFPTSSLKVCDAPGTMCYLAPEVVNGFYEDPENISVRKYTSYGFEADIWSLGVTICDSWRRGGSLFGIEEDDEDQNADSAIPPKILNMDIEPAVKEVVDGHPIWHLITRMLDRDQVTRIGFDDMLAHPVFAHLDWNRVATLGYTPTWDFPEPSRQPKPVKEEILFPSFYQSPEDIHVGTTDSEQRRAEKEGRRDRQLIRRAAGAARDWVGEQDECVKDRVLKQYDFDWTAKILTDDDGRWASDDD